MLLWLEAAVAAATLAAATAAALQHVCPLPAPLPAAACVPHRRQFLEGKTAAETGPFKATLGSLVTLQCRRGEMT